MSNRSILAIISPMSAQRLSGIARYAKEHGWNLMFQDRLGHHPLAWNGDGILATLRSDEASFACIRKLMRRGIPVVDLTASRPKLKVTRVTSDHRVIGRMAADYFKERNFTHIVWFSVGWGNVHALRFQGLSESAPVPPAKWIVSKDIPLDRQDDWKAFARWFRARFAASPKPLAVLCYDEADAARLLNVARACGVSVPEELAILSIGNDPIICENQAVPLSSIDQNLEVGGYEAARALDALITRKENGEKSAPRKTLIPPVGIVTRRSTDVIAVTDASIRKALEYMKQNLARPIGAPQIADAVGIRRAILDQKFRHELNRSVGEEIRRQRLARAKLLLKTTHLTVAAIAAQTGFCTASHLVNSFKADTGISPRVWRRERITCLPSLSAP